MRRLLLLGLLACQGKQEPPPPAAASVQVRDSSGVLVAELRPIRPCRGSIGPVDLIVGGPPLVANLGSTEWKGSAADNGTTLYRDGQPVVRVFPTGDPKTVSVLDLHGIALARIALREAKVGDRAAAEADITRALSLGASDSEVLYHSAVVHALAGDTTRALTSLEQALRNGYSAAIAAKDLDLSSLRNLPRFKQLVASQ